MLTAGSRCFVPIWPVVPAAASAVRDRHSFAARPRAEARLQTANRAVRQRKRETNMTSTTETSTADRPDLVAIKGRQQTTWASGDFSMVAARDRPRRRAARGQLRPPRRLAGPRRRSGQRQRDPRRRAVRRARDRRRLRPGAAGGRPGSRAGRGARRRVPARRRRGPAGRGRLDGRDPVGLRHDVRAGPPADGERAGPRHPQRRDDRAGVVDAGRLHRPDVPGHLLARARRRPACPRPCCGGPRRT